MIFLKKVWDFVCKWWQLLLGVALGVGVIIGINRCKNDPVVLPPSDKVAGVVDSAVKTNETTVVAIEEKTKKVEEAVVVANNQQDVRDEKIKADAKNASEEIEKTVKKKIKTSTASSPDDLAKEMAAKFGGQYVKKPNE